MSNVQRFGSYFLLKKIATGGMAELYKAKKSGEKGFEKLLAIKMILPHLSANEDFISMFIDEAKVAALLNHQNIVQIYDLGKIENAYCIVMEYVRGKDLKTVLSRAAKSKSRIGVEHACLITASALAGLAYAHRKKDKGHDLKIVHRDISPQNILVTYEGEVKIVDFGIAKAATQSRDTKVGVLKGKISYMSPEQAMGKPLDNRSDIFSMGVVLYEMLTGKKLFHGDTDLNTLEQVRAARVEPLPHELNNLVPRELEEILLKSLSKEPETRFQGASEMEESLQQFMRKAGYSTGSYSLSQFMYQLFKDDIEEEVAEEEGWDKTVISEGMSAGMRAASAGATQPVKPRPAPAARAVRPPAAATLKTGTPAKKGIPLLAVVAAALVAVAALAAGGLWLKTRAGQGVAQPETASQKPADTNAPPPVPAAPAAAPSAAPPAAEDRPAQPVPEAAAPAESPEKTPVASNPAPAPPAVASASITSEPSGAAVTLDGRAVGATPLDVGDLKPDQAHKVRMAKAGYEGWTGSFTAGPGETASVHASLNEVMASISANSTPGGARVLLDGQDTGKRTPASIDGLRPGRQYRVRLLLDGFAPFEQVVSPAGSRPASLNAALVQLYGTLTVDSRPWSVVIVDGDEKGTTPLAGIKLSAGEHRLALGNPKLRIGRRMKVKIEPDKTTRVVVDLTKAGQ